MTDDAPVRESCPDDVTVREARPGDLASVLGVLDAAALRTDRDRARASIDRGDTLVAVRVGSATDPDTPDRPVLGALVLVGDEIEAVAVRRRQRDRGVGRALVARAADRRDRLVAAFDANVCPFYETVGFDVSPLSGPDRDADRYRAILTGAPE